MVRILKTLGMVFCDLTSFGPVCLHSCHPRQHAQKLGSRCIALLAFPQHLASPCVPGRTSSDEVPQRAAGESVRPEEGLRRLRLHRGRKSMASLASSGMGRVCRLLLRSCASEPLPLVSMAPHVEV